MIKLFTVHILFCLTIFKQTVVTCAQRVSDHNSFVQLEHLDSIQNLYAKHNCNSCIAGLRYSIIKIN